MSITYYMARFRQTALPALKLLGIAGIIFIVFHIMSAMLLTTYITAMYSIFPPGKGELPMGMATGIVLINVSAVMYYAIFVIAGFMGRGIVVTMGRRPWMPLVRILSIMFLIHALLLVIGVYLIPDAGRMLGGYLIVYAIGSILILITSRLISVKTPSYLNGGITLLIASILIIISIVNVGNLLGNFFELTYQPSYIPGILLPISLMIASIGLVLYDFIKHKPLIQAILTIAALIFAIDLILKFTDVSNTVDALSLASYYGAYYMYGMLVPLLLGEILLVVVGILGLIALIMLLVVIIKSFTQPVAVAPAHQSPPPTMTSYQQ